MKYTKRNFSAFKIKLGLNFHHRIYKVNAQYHYFTGSHWDNLLQYLDSIQSVPECWVIGHQCKVLNSFFGVHTFFFISTTFFLPINDLALRQALGKSSVGKVSNLWVIDHSSIISFPAKVRKSCLSFELYDKYQYCKSTFNHIQENVGFNFIENITNKFSLCIPPPVLFPTDFHVGYVGFYFF